MSISTRIRDPEIVHNREGLIMSKSEDCLKEAFAGESQANRKYLAYAAKADKEGYPQIARMFRAAAEAETVHAHNHLRALKGIRSTKENLEAAISGETHEFKAMYPEMIEAAKAEGNKEAERTFTYANEVEKIHAQLYTKLLDTLGASQGTYPYYVCPVCGYTAEKEAPGVCPVCGTQGKMFKRVD
jgi:rubrerythrin